MTMPSATAHDPGREIVSTRLLNAPRELVWEAWTNPKHLAEWWGPKGFRNTFHEYDPRPGGAWRFTMHGPDGKDYKNEIIFVEFAKPGRIVFDHVAPKFRVIATFTEEAGKTRSTFRMIFDTAEECERKKPIAQPGNEQNFDRLEAKLAELAAASEEEFTVTREFNAPRSLVWKAHTELEHLKNWWGPKGFVWLGGKLDLRPGGMFHYGMKGPNNLEMWGKFVYREVTPQDRLVYVVSFSDPQGGTTRNPWHAGWPLEVLNTSTFEENGGRITVTLRGKPINASEEEIKAFNGGKPGMRQGFKGTLDQLEEYLKQVQS